MTTLKDVIYIHNFTWWMMHGYKQSNINLIIQTIRVYSQDNNTNTIEVFVMTVDVFFA